MIIRRSLHLYAGFVTACSLPGLWFALYICWPKAVYERIDPPELSSLPTWVTSLISQLMRTSDYFWPLACLAFLLFVLGLMPFIAERARSACRWVLVLFSLVILPSSLGIFLATFIASEESYRDQDHKMRVYLSVLDEFTLRQTAENRFEDIQKKMLALTSMHAVEIHSASQLSKTEQKQKLTGLAGYLGKTDSPDLKKKLLATTYLLRDSAPVNKYVEEAILTTAREQTGQDFQDLNTFYEWLKPQLGQEPWTPLPIYHWEVTK